MVGFQLGQLFCVSRRRSRLLQYGRESRDRVDCSYVALCRGACGHGPSAQLHRRGGRHRRRSGRGGRITRARSSHGSGSRARASSTTSRHLAVVKQTRIGQWRLRPRGVPKFDGQGPSSVHTAVAVNPRCGACAPGRRVPCARARRDRVRDAARTTISHAARIRVA